MARAVLFGDSVETQGYRVVDGTIYDLRSQYLELASRPIGTVTFGLPIAQEDVEAIGEVGGFEACLYHGGVCVVRTQRVDDELRDAMLGSVGVDEPLRIQSGGSEWSIRSEPLVAGDPSQGQRVVAVPLDDVLAPFDSIQRALIFGGGGALLLSILFGTALSRNLTRPVKELVAATTRVAEGDYETEVTVTSHDEMRTLADAFNDMTRGLLMRERYRSVLSKVVSQDIAEELMKGDVELGGENREMSVLFADIRGFTPLTEGMEPQAVIGLLNDCMEHLARAVDDEGGVVDKFIGDEVMAVFGAPVTQPDHARRAVAAAVRMRDGIEDMNLRRIEGGADPISIGIGIATGVAVAGNMGSHDRMNYTVLGATVNLAARLTSEAEAGEILISAPTCRAVDDAYAVTALGDRSLKGFSSDVQVYAVQSIREGVREAEHGDDEWRPTATSLGRPR
jgi:adenylate cyclase